MVKVGENSDQLKGSLANRRPPWSEEGGLKEEVPPGEAPPGDPEIGGMKVDIPARNTKKKKARYMPRVCQELLNISVASIMEECGTGNQAAGTRHHGSLFSTAEEKREGQENLTGASTGNYACSRATSPGGNVWPEAASSGALGDDSCSLTKWLTSSCGLWPEKFQGLRSVSRKKTARSIGDLRPRRNRKGVKRKRPRKKNAA
jgi:hypothetical protein